MLDLFMHVTLADVAIVVTMVVGFARTIRSLSRLEQKVELMWAQMFPGNDRPPFHRRRRTDHD